MPILLIDGGGTSTDVMLVANGLCEARTALPSTKPTVSDTGTDALCRMLGSFIAGTAFSPELEGSFRIDAVIIGMAGVWHPPEHARYQQTFAESWSVYVGGLLPDIAIMSDVELVLFAAVGSAMGTALVAGTGSVCITRSQTGVISRSGGWGPRLDDAGGGNWLGQQACLAVARMLDRRGPSTTLIRPVAAYLRVDHQDHSAVMYGLRRSSLDGVAKLGTAVLTYADEEDVVAILIRNQGAAALAELVTTLRPQSEEPLHVYGSLLLNTGYRELLTQRISSEIILINDLLDTIRIRLVQQS